MKNALVLEHYYMLTKIGRGVPQELCSKPSAAKINQVAQNHHNIKQTSRILKGKMAHLIHTNSRPVLLQNLVEMMAEWPAQRHFDCNPEEYTDTCKTRRKQKRSLWRGCCL
jgi:hypothetical protein